MLKWWRIFIKGLGSIFVFYPKQHDQNLFPKRRSFVSDAEALRSDWDQVGKDMRKAITKYKEEHNLD